MGARGEVEERSPDPARGRIAGRLAAPALLFVGVFFVFFHSPVRQAGDSHYSLLLAQRLLEGRGFALEEAFRIPLDEARYPGLAGRELPYQIESVRGHLVYAFPPGSSVLSAPLVALLRPAGLSATDATGAYDLHGELKMERRLAALLAAAFVVLCWALARRFLDRRTSQLVALAVAFASPVWSTVSRALWGHDWYLLLVGGVLLLLAPGAAAGPERSPTPPRSLAAGLLLGVAFTVRPTAVVAVVACATLLASGDGPRRVRGARIAGLAAGFAAIVALFCAWSLAVLGSLLPGYYRAGRLGWPIPEALAGTLVSPSRGLFVFLPVLLGVAWLLVRYRRSLPARPLVAAALVAVVLHWLVCSTFAHWWGGKCYGPRLLVDALPWLVLLAVAGLRAWRDAPARAHRQIEMAVLAVLLAAGVAIHAAGATARQSNRWNDLPLDVDRHPERLWDWRDPQFLAWTTSRLAGATGQPSESQL